MPVFMLQTRFTVLIRDLLQLRVGKIKIGVVVGGVGRKILVLPGRHQFGGKFKKVGNADADGIIDDGGDVFDQVHRPEQLDAGGDGGPDVFAGDGHAGSGRRRRVEFVEDGRLSGTASVTGGGGDFKKFQGGVTLSVVGFAKVVADLANDKMEGFGDIEGVDGDVREYLIEVGVVFDSDEVFNVAEREITTAGVDEGLSR